jgi:predicted dehydrogenase
MTTRLTRRSALKLGAASGLGYLFTGPSFSVLRAQGSNARLRVAGIGVGGKGSSDIDQAGNLMEVVALVDIDETDKFLGAKAKKWGKAKTFTDYRKLFDDAVFKNVDAVTVSTPDHHHATAAIPCMRAGKHVYVQKPLTQTVFEARMMAEAARKYKVCTQMGNQGTAANGLRRAAELVQKGELGAVKEVHVWTNRPIWPQAPKVMKRPDKTDPVPATLHWDEFLGKAPERPYVGGRTYHDFAWRGWWDFGTGAIGDMACHTANMAFMGLKLANPTKVSAEAGDVNPETCPSWAHVTMEFAKRGDLAACTLHWYEGKRDNKKVLPPDELVAKALKVAGANKLVDSGSILVGEKGIAYSPDDYGANVFFETGPKTGNDTKPETMAVNNKGDQGQKNEWVEAIKAGKPTLALSNFDYASALTEAFLLGNVAIRTGKPFNWDGVNFKATGNDEAMKYIKGAYRKGWDLIGEKA